MKFRNIFSILALIALFTISCDDEADNLGKEIRPAGDEIIVQADTFHLSSETLLVENIISRPDSFLLGKFMDKTIGLTEGELLGELQLFQEGFTFLDDAVALTEVDSVVLQLTFPSFFGNPSPPMHISVYELKDSLKRNTPYPSNMDYTPYVDMTKLIGDTTFSVKDGVTDKIHTGFNLRMKDSFVKRFFTTDPLHYRSQGDFRKFFPGIYIKTDFGTVTMLNVRTIKMSMYYHYAYRTDLSQKLYGKKEFYVSPEVKKVNRILHPIQQDLLQSLNLNEEYNYIASPANYYTQVRIPLERIRNDIKNNDRIKGKILTVNSASIKLNVKKIQTSDETLIPYVNNLLLIKKDSVDEFFKRRKPLSDSYAFYAGRDSIYKGPNNYDYEFNFSGLAGLIETEIKKSEENNTPLPPYLDMVLVPITPTFRQASGSSSRTVSEVIQSNLMEAITIYSGKNKSIPMKMEIIYSGF